MAKHAKKTADKNQSRTKDYERKACQRRIYNEQEQASVRINATKERTNNRDGENVLIRKQGIIEHKLSIFIGGNIRHAQHFCRWLSPSNTA